MFEWSGPEFLLSVGTRNRFSLGHARCHYFLYPFALDSFDGGGGETCHDDQLSEGVVGIGSRRHFDIGSGRL